MGKPSVAGSVSADPSIPVRVLVTGGVGRSGSTLLHRMVGQLQDCLALGEASSAIWRKSLGRNATCGCGAAFADCDFWGAVGERAFGGWRNLDVERVLALQASVDKTKFLPVLAARHQPRGFADRLAEYRMVLARLLHAVQDVSGAGLLVDSSKRPSTAYILRGTPGIELSLAHLVRDPRGVACSWSHFKATHLIDEDGKPVPMPTWSARRSARRYLTVNLAVEALRPLGVPTVRIRYEDLVQHPDQALRRVAQLLPTTLDERSLAFVQDGSVTLPTDHACTGNPSRFDTGRVPLRLDDKWRRELTLHDRRIVETITWPLRVRYGYS